MIGIEASSLCEHELDGLVAFLAVCVGQVTRLDAVIVLHDAGVAVCVDLFGRLASLLHQQSQSLVEQIGLAVGAVSHDADVDVRTHEVIVLAVINLLTFAAPAREFALAVEDHRGHSVFIAAGPTDERLDIAGLMEDAIDTGMQPHGMLLAVNEIGELGTAAVRTAHLQPVTPHDERLDAHARQVDEDNEQGNGKEDGHRNGNDQEDDIPIILEEVQRPLHHVHAVKEGTAPLGEALAPPDDVLMEAGNDTADDDAEAAGALLLGEEYCQQATQQCQAAYDDDSPQEDIDDPQHPVNDGSHQKHEQDGEDETAHHGQEGGAGKGVGLIIIDPEASHARLGVRFTEEGKGVVVGASFLLVVADDDADL